MLRVRVAMSGWTGGPGLSTFYFRNTTENLAAAQAVADRVHNFFTTTVPVFNSGTLIDMDENVDVVDPGTGAVTDTLITTPSANITGTGSSGALAPAAVAILMQLNTTTWIAGRRVRGRSFISPLTSNAISNTGEMAPAMLTVLNPGQVALVAGFPTENALCVWHRPKAGVGGSTAPVTSITFPSKLAILRSRRD